MWPFTESWLRLRQHFYLLLKKSLEFSKYDDYHYIIQQMCTSLELKLIVITTFTNPANTGHIICWANGWKDIKA